MKAELKDILDWVQEKAVQDAYGSLEGYIKRAVRELTQKQEQYPEDRDFYEGEINALENVLWAMVSLANEEEPEEFV